MDQEFGNIDDNMDLVLVNITAAREHVTEIERGIHTVKESCCYTMSLLPNNVIPKQVVIHLVYFAILWINSASADNGTSDKFSPCKIVTHRELDHNKY